MKKSPRGIPKRLEPVNAIRCRIFGIVTTIAARTTDNRRKTILHELVRFTIPIGCRIDCRLARLPRFNSLDMRACHGSSCGQLGRNYLEYALPTNEGQAPEVFQDRTKLDGVFPTVWESVEIVTAACRAHLRHHENLPFSVPVGIQPERECIRNKG
jgi:hypothetical protein